MHIYTLDEIAERMIGINMSAMQRGTGLSRPTLYALRDKHKTDFMMSVVIAASNYLKTLESKQ